MDPEAPPVPVLEGQVRLIDSGDDEDADEDEDDAPRIRVGIRG